MAKLTDRLQKRLRKWLIPRSDMGVVIMRVELEGADKMCAELDAIEQRLDRIATKAGAAQDALGSLSDAQGKVYTNCAAEDFAKHLAIASKWFSDPERAKRVAGWYAGGCTNGT